MMPINTNAVLFSLLTFFLFLKRNLLRRLEKEEEVGKRDTPSRGNNIDIKKVEKKETDSEHTLVTDDSGSYGMGATETVNDDSPWGKRPMGSHVLYVKH